MFIVVKQCAGDGMSIWMSISKYVFSEIKIYMLVFVLMVGIQVNKDIGAYKCDVHFRKMFNHNYKLDSNPR